MSTITNKDILQLGDYLRPNNDFSVKKTSGICDACGAFGPYAYKKIINHKLAEDWNLDNDERVAFSCRESMFCQFCGCSYRLRALAKALSLHVSREDPMSLNEAIENGKLHNLKVAEINSCGVLHDILKNIPNLSYSEYGSTVPEVPHEDLMALSYADDSFDIVLTSDTLEHVPDPLKALEEIKRVLKPNGIHLFTVPLRLEKNTVVRASLAQNEKKEKLLPSSYHGSGEQDYFVWNEFGRDFLTLVQGIYCTVSLQFLNPLNMLDPVSVISASNKTTKQSNTKTVDCSYASTTGVERVQDMYGKEKVVLLAEPTINLDHQLEREEYIFNKFQLTASHIENLESITLGQREHIDSLESKLQRIERALPIKMFLKLRSLLRK
ncbi:MAG: class I SAM-dependent methyltransferase [Candidatus Saccharimonadales bacterium]